MLFGVLLTRSSTYTHPALAAPARPATQSPITSSPVIVFVFALISIVAIRHMISIFAAEERACLFKAHDLHLRCFFRLLVGLPVAGLLRFLLLLLSVVAVRGRAARGRGTTTSQPELEGNRIVLNATNKPQRQRPKAL